MEIHERLLEISRLLLSADDAALTAELLLRRLLEMTGAERGFIVVRRGRSYEPSFDVRFDPALVSDVERSFSRSLVRQVIRTREILDSENLLEDPRFAQAESVRALGPGAVLVAPLGHGGEVWGALYLERPGAHFSTEARALIASFADIAGAFLRRALEREELNRRTASLERDLYAKHDFRGIVTAHPAMLEMLRTVAQVADSEATVLLLGESGTGKELVAQALHVNSSRFSKPFVALHCAALPASVLESELFGHERGAFTGAVRDRPGRLASADGGTLLLDEVAEIPLELQAKLLRFLQSGEIQRLGSDKTEVVDVRVVAATHQDLLALVQAGRFRQDLYYRLKVIELVLPPLRERKSDVQLLTAHFLGKHWKRPEPKPLWTAEARERLQAYAYPGNVRELEHVIQRACVLATGPALGAELLPPEVQAAGAGPPAGLELTLSSLQTARDQAVAEVERAFLHALLNQHGRNVSKAARGAGMTRRHLQKLLAKHKLPTE